VVHLSVLGYLLLPSSLPSFRTSQKAGSGSHEQDGLLCIVAIEEEKQTGLVHDHRLGKRYRHAHKTGQTLAQRSVPALHGGRFSRLFSHRNVLLLWDHRRRGRPEIREAVPLPSS
jgi:hypothetical protein